MSGFDNDIVFAKNADFTQADNQNVNESNGLITDGEIWIGATSANAGGTHINVGSITSPDSSITVGYSSPNITLQVASASGIQTINGDSGSITGSTVTIFANQVANTCGATIRFENSGTTSTLNVSDSDSNTVLGLISGSTSLGGGGNTVFGAANLYTGGESNCVAVGVNCLLGGGGDGNIGIGFHAGNAIAASTGCVLMGTLSGASMSNVNGNTGIGRQSLWQLVGGSYNTAIGIFSGSEYIGNESNNALFNSPGVVGDSQVMRLGDPAQQTTAFIAGVASVVVSNTEMVTIDTTTGQLGSQAIGGGPSYTTGTFTPTVDGSTGGTTTYTAQDGFYTQIGNRIYVDIVIGLTAMTGTGDVVFAGLPFNFSSASVYYAVGTIYMNAPTWAFPAGLTQLITVSNGGTDNFNVYGNGTIATPSKLQCQNAPSVFIISMSYQSP